MWKGVVLILMGLALGSIYLVLDSKSTIVFGVISFAAMLSYFGFRSSRKHANSAATVALLVLWALSASFCSLSFSNSTYIDNQIAERIFAIAAGLGFFVSVLPMLEFVGFMKTPERRHAP